MVTSYSRLRVLLTAAGLTVAAILLVDSLGRLTRYQSMLVDRSAQIAAGLFATAACIWTARRSRGAERYWRQLMAIGLGGWSAGHLVCMYYPVVAGESPPTPSWADLGYLVLPAMAFVALLAVGFRGPPGRDGPDLVHRSPVAARLVLVLDGLVVVGSLLVLAWATALGAVVRAGGPTPLAFAVAITYPATDLILVVMLALLLFTWQVPMRLRPQLMLLGIGLAALAISDSTFAYLLASGANRFRPISNAGLIAGPVLVGLAALTPARVHAPDPPGRTGRRLAWAKIIGPYLPLTATGLVILWQEARGQLHDQLEIYLGMAVMTLVVIRQLITLIDNRVLIQRVSEAQERLTYQAYHDPLTGLANRALFRDRLSTAVDLNRSVHRALALFFIDLDDFNQVNDTLGHAAGDRLLMAVGERLRSCVRSIDTVARLGGDEFGILVEGAADYPDRVGERILAGLREPFFVDALPVTIGASIGAAVPDGSEPGLTADALLRRADCAMYAGKERGKGLLVLYGSGTADGFEDADLPTRLAAALAAGPDHPDLDVHYQPIVRMADGAQLAVEALARWTDPTIGAVPPTVFVAVAERAGLIGTLDDFVLRRSCRDLSEYLAAHGGDLAVHVNISASRLGNPELECTVAQTLERYGLPAGHLILEVTETSRIPDPIAAVASAERLRAMGVRMALDDFGTGYNSLAQLHLLPLDIVKLDRSVTEVNGADPAGPRSLAICRSVVTIATELGMAVIAEGVETVDQAATLAAAGCGQAQGHLYGRAAPLAEVVPTAAAPVPPPMAGEEPVRRPWREPATS